MPSLVIKVRKSQRDWYSIYPLRMFIHNTVVFHAVELLKFVILNCEISSVLISCSNLIALLITVGCDWNAFRQKNMKMLKNWMFCSLDGSPQNNIVYNIQDPYRVTLTEINTVWKEIVLHKKHNNNRVCCLWQASNISINMIRSTSIKRANSVTQCI